MQKEPEDSIIRKPELYRKIGLSDTSVWRMEKNGMFPKRLQLGANSVGWLASEVDNWIKDRAANR